MVAENYFANRRGTTSSSFTIASSAVSSKLVASGGELLVQTTAGAPALLGSADVDLGTGFTAELVNKFSNRFLRMLGQSGVLSAPLFGATVVGDTLLKATQPGLEGVAGPIFTSTDIAGPATNLSVAGAAGHWYGLRGVVPVPGVGEVSRGAGLSSILYARLSIPATLAQSFFVGGLEAVSAVALPSGPDPSLAGLSGAMAIVKLAGDPTWNAFARIPGGAATKVPIGPPVALGTEYQFLIEAATSGAVRFTVLDAASAILGQIAFPGASFGAAPNHYHFNVGAFVAGAAPTDFDFFSMSAVRVDSYQI